MAERLAQPSPEELDLLTTKWSEVLSQAPIYKKDVKVQIRKAVPGERVVTKVSDGTEETVNTAKEDEVIITNPGGEEYILSGKRAMAEYEPTEDQGTFQSKGMVRAVQNPTGSEIEIDSPWGGKEVDGQDCMIAVSFDPSQPDIVGNQRYLIAQKEFQDTYRPVDLQLKAAA